MKPLPLYQSHKKVRALKIHRVSLLPGEDQNHNVAHIWFDEPGYEAIKVDLFGKPTPHGGWYYVQYEPTDGQPEPYESFSPPEAFEKGYRLITDWENYR